MAELQKISKIGGSCMITLPKQLFDMLGWKKEHEVKVKIVDGGNLLIVNVSLEVQKDVKKDFFK